MPSPELLAPDRAERLLSGAPPETAREADVERMVRELRALSAPAPGELRERVRRLSAPPSKRTRSRLAAAFAAAAVLVTAVAAIAIVGREEPGKTAEPASVDPPAAGATPTTPSPTPIPSWGDQDSSADHEKQPHDLFKGAGPTLALDSGDAPKVRTPPGVVTDAGRAQDVDQFIALRLKNADGVSQAAGDALRITRDLGGVVTASAVDTSGREGTARLELSIPTRRLDDAIVRLSALGTITEQRVATRDLQGGIDRRGRRIEQLQTAVRADELRLASGTLDPGEKLEVELRLLRERGRLRELTGERARLLREAAYAEVTLTLHTREAAGAPSKKDGIGGAARDAVDALGRAGEVAVFAGILLAPLLAVGLVLWLALRSRRRRADDRLLEQPRPTAPAGP